MMSKNAKKVTVLGDLVSILTSEKTQFGYYDVPLELRKYISMFV